MAIRLTSPPPGESLERQLDEARALFKKRCANTDYGLQRISLMFALRSITKFLESSYGLDRGCELGASLDELYNALSALNDGLVMPILQPATIPHRPRNARAETARAEVAALLGWLIDRENSSRMRRIEAARMIATRLTKRGRRTEASEIIEWRKEALTRLRDDRFRQQYEHQLNEHKWWQKYKFGQRILEKLAEIEGIRIDPVAYLDSLRFLPPPSRYRQRLPRSKKVKST